MPLPTDSRKRRQAAELLPARPAGRMLPAVLPIALRLTAAPLVAVLLIAARLLAALPIAVWQFAVRRFGTWRFGAWRFAQRLRSAMPVWMARVKRALPRGCGRMAAERNLPRQGPAWVRSGPGG